MHPYGFHSTDFPYERGQKDRGEQLNSLSRVSIQLISPTRGDLPSMARAGTTLSGFHSTDFPYERGPIQLNLDDKIVYAIGFPFN